MPESNAFSCYSLDGNIDIFFPIYFHKIYAHAVKVDGKKTWQKETPDFQAAHINIFIAMPYTHNHLTIGAASRLMQIGHFRCQPTNQTNSPILCTFCIFIAPSIHIGICANNKQNRGGIMPRVLLLFLFYCFALTLTKNKIIVWIFIQFLFSIIL